MTYSKGEEGDTVIFLHFGQTVCSLAQGMGVVMFRFAVGKEINQAAEDS